MSAMGVHNSPFYAAGVADRQRDAALEADGKEPAGPDPEREWSWMYKRGYGAIDQPATNAAHN